MLGMLTGCATPIAKPARSVRVNTTEPRIELLGFTDCPNTPTMRHNLRAALAAIGEGWTFTDTIQEKLPEDDIRRGYPSPTVLVNNRDLYDLPVPTVVRMGCRMYPGGVPDASEIAQRLQAAACGR
jgi:hypothetical protein